MDYEDSQPYKLGLIYRRLADLLMDPTTTFAEIGKFEADMGCNLILSLVPNADSPLNGPDGATGADVETSPIDSLSFDEIVQTPTIIALQDLLSTVRGYFRYEADPREQAVREKAMRISMYAAMAALEEADDG